MVPGRTPSPRAGLSLVELLIVMVIVAVTLGEVTRSLLNVSHLEPVQRESAAALEGARTLLEEMRALPFADLVATYDQDPANDPGAPGTAPGPDFDVEGLAAQDGSPSGKVGSIELPLLAGQLREDIDDVELGMPRDLSGDGVTDTADHIGDYVVLPVRVRVDWTGAGGDRSLEIVTTVSPYE